MKFYKSLFNFTMMFLLSPINLNSSIKFNLTRNLALRNNRDRMLPIYKHVPREVTYHHLPILKAALNGTFSQRVHPSRKSLPSSHWPALHGTWELNWPPRSFEEPKAVCSFSCAANSSQQRRATRRAFEVLWVTHAWVAGLVCLWG